MAATLPHSASAPSALASPLRRPATKKPPGRHLLDVTSHLCTPMRTMTLFSRLRTPTYKNTGSVARDHLASERTLLAWLRTGLGFIALGIAVERFSQLDLSLLLAPKTAVARPPNDSDLRARTDLHEQHGLTTADDGAARQGRGAFRAQLQSQPSQPQPQILRMTATPALLPSQASRASPGNSQLLVGALMGVGAGAIAYGAQRYFVNMRLLERGLFRPAYYGVGAMAVAVAGLAGGVYAGAVRGGETRKERVKHAIGCPTE
ncbi:uncharacterized protein IWZ02DRAFT_16098 [Phyllosticta citriasiana]|uniref:uncharacterized protein n=1 Tax=Phyllosticta citriasiana TaxID=595635 RepID=UPI0030FDD3D7